MFAYSNTETRDFNVHQHGGNQFCDVTWKWSFGMVKSREWRNAELAVMTGHVSIPNKWNYSFGQIKRLQILLWSLSFFFLKLNTNWSHCFFLLLKLKKKKSQNRGVAMWPELNQNPMLLNLHSLFWIFENEFSNLKSKRFSRIREEVEYFLDKHSITLEF